MTPFAGPADHLRAELELLDLRLAREVRRLRAARLVTADDFRGLYVSDEQVDRLLAGPDATHDVASEADAGIASLAADNDRRAGLDDSLPLTRLSRAFKLGRFELDVLLLAAAAEFDLRYTRLFAYAQDDVTCRHPTVDLALRLLCASREDGWSRRAAFAPDRPLVRHALVEFVSDPHDHDRPLGARRLKVAPRVADFLLGLRGLDPTLDDSTRLLTPGCRLTDLEFGEVFGRQVGAAAAASRDGGLLRLRGNSTSGAGRVAEAVCSALGLDLIVHDAASVGPVRAGKLLRRDALLLRAGLLVVLPDDSASATSTAVGALARDLAFAPFPVVLAQPSRASSSATWSAARVFSLDLPAPALTDRHRLWAHALNGSTAAPEGEGTLRSLAGTFHLNGAEIDEVVRDARDVALLRGAGRHEVSAADVHDAARIRNSPGLRRLARKVEARFGWGDLILPPRASQQLRESCEAVRQRQRVLAEWGFARKAGRQAGVCVLFAGPSGTGKTLAASVLAGELGLDLYRIDLSSVVSKYIGETEKHLNTLFEEAERSTAALLFDEADALFGRRSEVKDARDRYANIEVAFLLQRLEEFPGLVILATNLKANLDPAFARRMQHVVEFPMPDAALRERIWRDLVPASAPLGPDVDFGFLARQFELSGGNVRNAVVAAAFLAAERNEPIGMAHLILATAREYQKLGRLPSKAEFRDHYESIRERV